MNSGGHLVRTLKIIDTQGDRLLKLWRILNDNPELLEGVRHTRVSSYEEYVILHVFCDELSHALDRALPETVTMVEQGVDLEIRADLAADVKLHVWVGFMEKAS